MNQLTLIDKVQVLFKLLFSSPAIIGIFIFSMILMILLFFYSKLNRKAMKYIFIGIYVGLIGFAVFKYGNYFLTSIDSFVTLFMANIYFPIIPVYIAIMLISFIIMVVTLSNKNNHRVVKIINTVFFTFIQMLFALFIYIVEVNKIDLSSNGNLYSNEQTMTLLELGMGLFVLWIFILIIIFYLKKADKIFKTKKNDDSDDFDEYINDYNEPSGVSVTPSDITPIMNNNFDTNSFNKPADVDNSFVNTQNSFINPINTNNDFIPPVDNLASNVDNSTKNKFDIFDDFDFIDLSNEVERKTDDVEIVDIDF